jgi:hypothetical protein
MGYARSNSAVLSLSGKNSITSGHFVMAWLSAGGRHLPTQGACDANGSRQMRLMRALRSPVMPDEWFGVDHRIGIQLARNLPNWIRVSQPENVATSKSVENSFATCATSPRRSCGLGVWRSAAELSDQCSAASCLRTQAPRGRHRLHVIVCRAKRHGATLRGRRVHSPPPTPNFGKRRHLRRPARKAWPRRIELRRLNARLRDLRRNLPPPRLARPLRSDAAQ